MVWKASQWQKTTASAVPKTTSCQNNFGNSTRMNIATDRAIIIANVAIPIRELGNPKTSACSESITLLQFMLALILQDGVKPASFKTLNLSIVKMNEAKKPVRPAISKAPAEIRLSSLIMSV